MFLYIGVACTIWPIGRRVENQISVDSIVTTCQGMATDSPSPSVAKDIFLQHVFTDIKEVRIYCVSYDYVSIK